MAAGVKKKRLAGTNLQERCSGTKKKKTKSSKCAQTLRSHTNLEWDDDGKRTVAKRKQVAITRTDMAPFVDSVSKHSSGLAGVLSVPQEIFSLDNLSDVLSYEVWTNHLLESERKLLAQFLPSGIGVEKVLQSLLAGDNHHFGNPFLQWSSLLCSGVLHPDNAVRAQEELRARKSAYYGELSRYHNDMIELLRKWGELWMSCEDPEKSWSEGFIKHKQGSLTILEGREEMPNRMPIGHNNPANNPCYVKISREQDVLALVIEQYGDDLRSWSLNQGLEDIKACTIQPYAVSVEEENKRLHDHWSNLANEDIPAAYKDLREKKLHRERWNVSLQQELAEKKLLAADEADVENNLHNILQEQTEVGDTVHHSITEMSDCDHDFTPSSTTAPLEQVGSLTCHPQISSIVPEYQVDGGMLKLLNNSSLHAQAFRRAVSPNYAWEPETSIASSKDISQEVGILNSLYQTGAASQTYKSPSSLQQFKSIQEDSYPLIGLSRDTTDRVGEPSHLFHPNGSAMLSSYPQGHINGLIQPELQFPIANGCTSSSGHSSCHFQEQKQLLEQMQISKRELYMHYNGEHFNGRHPIRHLSPINQLGISSLQSPAIGGLVGQNWFPVERRDYADWSTNQYLRNYQNAEGNPFRVLLPSHTSYNTTNSQQFMQANNFPGGAIQNHANNYLCAPSLPNSSSGHEAPQNSLRTNSMLSVNCPQNDPYLHGLAENPFLIPRSQ